MNYIQYTPKENTVKSIENQLGDRGKILGFYKDERGYRYSLIRFEKCGHESYIKTGKCVDCNNKECLFEKMSQIRKISHNRPEVKAKMRQINIENNAKPEVKAKHQKHFQEYWADEENRKMQSQKKLDFFSSDENRNNHSELLKNYYSTHEEYKQEVTERLFQWRDSVSNETLEEINIRRIRTMNTQDARKRASHHFKEYYSDLEHKKEYLNRVVKQQRAQKNKYEMMFIKMLEEHNVDYVWQYPILTEDGKGFVIDFYLPQYDLLINIDGSIHGFNGTIQNPLVDLRVNSDYMLDNYCKRKGMKIHHVDTRDLKGLNFDLKEVINL